MTNAKVSVIVPVYNVKDYLEACINSICCQTYQNIEVILIDDGSTDGCGNICDRYAEQYENIQVIHKKNGGLAAARNSGLEVSTGEYVAFIDSDDQIHPRFVEEMLRLCEDNDCGMAICSYRSDAKWDENAVEKNKAEVLDYTELLDRFYTDDHIRITVAWNKLYRRSIIGDLRYVEGVDHEDEYTTAKFIYRAKRIAQTDAQLYCYTLRDGSIMQRPFSLKRLDGLGAYLERRKFFIEHGEDKYAIREEYCYMSAILNYHAKLKKFLPEEKAKQRELIKEYRQSWRRFDRKCWGWKRRVFYLLGYCWPSIYIKMKK
ncbi:MAG: glycosyltransferase [Lachnospiraceae bacterium]|nr:glycosyltransferase [Lachnospiraceae bacterium]